MQPEISLRDLAHELGISLGNANYCLQGLMERGLVKANNFKNSNNKKAYLYLLTRKALPEAWRQSDRLELVEHQYDAPKGADALALVTEWKPFRHPDFDSMRKLMKTPVIFDGRNQYDPQQVRAAGFEYFGIGR